MKRMIIMLVTISALLSGCFASPNVKRTENRNGEEIVILKDNTANTGKDNQKYANEIESIKELANGEKGFLIGGDNVLIIRPSGQSAVDIINYNRQSKSEVKLLEKQEGEYFQVSPDGKKMLFVQGSSICTFEIPRNGEEKPVIRSINPNENLLVKKLRYMDKENVFLDYSTGWGDAESIVYSDRHGAIYVVKDSSEKPRVFDIDSAYKTNIKMVDGKAIYLKKDFLRMEDLGLKNDNYPKGNYLSFSSRDSMSDIMLEPSESLNIIDYRISPDGEKIALYFENKDHEGALFIANVKGTLFTGNILYRNLVHVSSGKINDFKWSRDSSKLAYSIGEGTQRLCVVNSDGSDNTPLVENISISGLDWNFEGSGFICVGENNSQKAIFEINLK